MARARSRRALQAKLSPKSFSRTLSVDRSSHARWPALLRVTCSLVSQQEERLAFKVNMLHRLQGANLSRPDGNYLSDGAWHCGELERHGSHLDAYLLSGTGLFLLQFVLLCFLSSCKCFLTNILYFLLKRLSIHTRIDRRRQKSSLRLLTCLRCTLRCR